MLLFKVKGFDIKITTIIFKHEILLSLKISISKHKGYQIETSIVSNPKICVVF